MIYISGALKGSSDLSAARELYERVADIVEGLGQDAYVPHKATDPEGNPTIPPGEVFRTDVDNILASKGVIAFLNEPSLGVGTEIAICIHESIPVFGFPAMNPRPLTRFLDGSIRFRLRKSTLASLPPHLRLPPSSRGGHRRARRDPSRMVSTPGAVWRPSRTAANRSHRLL